MQWELAPLTIKNNAKMVRNMAAEACGKVEICVVAKNSNLFFAGRHICAPSGCCFSLPLSHWPSSMASQPTNCKLPPVFGLPEEISTPFEHLQCKLLSNENRKIVQRLTTRYKEFLKEPQIECQKALPFRFVFAEATIKDAQKRFDRTCIRVRTLRKYYRGISSQRTLHNIMPSKKGPLPNCKETEKKKSYTEEEREDSLSSLSSNSLSARDSFTSLSSAASSTPSTTTSLEAPKLDIQRYEKLFRKAWPLFAYGIDLMGIIITSSLFLFLLLLYFT